MPRGSVTNDCLKSELDENKEERVKEKKKKKISPGCFTEMLRF